MDPVSFSDLPGSWWKQLTNHADYDSLLALSRASHGLHDRVVTNWDFHRVELQCDPETIEQSASTLSLALEQSDRVALELITPEDWSGSYDEDFDINMSASAVAVVCRAITSARAGLVGVRAVHLAFVVLDSLVPAWLVAACFNMKELHLEECQFINLPAAPTVHPLCPQLERLVWTNRETMLDMAAVASVAQLQALPGLTNLAFNGRRFADLATFAVVGAQLTALRIGYTPPDNAAQLQQLVAWFPALHTLNLDTYCVEDEGLDVLLLALPTLRHLTVCEFKLNQDHSNQQCQWTRLAMLDVDIPCVARLPLEQIPKLQWYLPCYTEVDITPSADLPTTQRVVDTLIAHGWRESKLPADNYQTCRIQAERLSEDHTLAVLPLLLELRQLSFIGCNVTVRVLTELRVHMLKMPRDVIFNYCIFAPNVWPVLLPLLQGVASVTVLDHRLTEAQLLEACVNANGPIELITNACVPWEVFKGRVQAGMAAAGHQHVTLVRKWP